MPANILSRPAETRAVAEFLASASVEPSALLVEGEAGIGKTTLWLAALDEADTQGFQVLSARPSAAESVLAYTSLADMLNDVDPNVWSRLPGPQRLAIDQVLLRASSDGQPTDQRAVAAGFLSVVKALAAESPVLIAIDDLQWLDASSVQIIGYAARRLSGCMGVLGTVRSDPDCTNATAWLQMPGLDAIRRITLGPLSFGGLREVVAERVGREVSRRSMVRIHEVSQGNPFYAVELARVLDERAPTSEMPLPNTIADLVHTRIGNLGVDVRAVLLAASCVAAPTVELVARATGCDFESVVELLADAEKKKIIEIQGNRVHFTHPLLSRGIYTEATAAQRRTMHRCLAEIVEEPELQARHLAMGVAWVDPNVLGRLDEAATGARLRGAPATAAELLDLAVGLGGATAERRIQLAGNHFEAGDSARARSLLDEIVADLEPGPLRGVALSLLGSVRAFGDSFTEGVELWRRSAAESAGILALRVPTLVILALTQFSTGRLTEGVPTADQAVAEATRLGDPVLLSQALGVRALIRFLRGEGVDEAEVQQALELEKRPSSSVTATGLHMVLSPSLQQGLLLGWSGEFERAHRELMAVRRLCDEYGHEFEWMYVAYYSTQIEIWWGNLTEAALIAEEAMTRAKQTEGDIATGAALTMRAAVAAYAGNDEQARGDAAEAITMHQRCGARMLAEWPIALLGFLEVSVGHYAAALTALQPILSRYGEGQFGTEIHVAAFVPDAVEAMVQVGRLDDAEALTEALECNGRRLDRAWMLAVGARCRGMLLAARGDLDAAIEAAQAAMTEHDRMAMPFERARTQLLLGRLQRRLRRRDAATSTLREALGAFEEMGTPVWAERARAELNRTNAGHGPAGDLTVSEQRVADLAASGMTNQDVAAALFISPKTVEANLARIYRKLGIHSRAELGRWVAQPER